MVRFFVGIFDYLHRRRFLCMGLLAAIICVMLIMVAFLKYNENIYDFLPLSDSQQKSISLYQDISGGQRVVVLFRAKDSSSFDSGCPKNAVDTFINKISLSGGERHFLDIESQVDFDKYAGITDFVYQNIPLMLKDSDYVRIDSLLSSEHYVDGQLEANVLKILMPATGFFSSSISSDPLSLFSPVLQRLLARQQSIPFEFDDGYIFTSGKDYAIAMLSSRYGAMESSNNNRMIDYLDSISRQTELAVPQITVAFTGSPVISVDNARRIKSDSKIAIAIAVTLILLLLIFYFRRKKNLLLIGLAILFGWLFAMAFISALRSDVSLIVIGIGSIIIGIAVNYPLHFVAHTEHGASARQTLKEMVAPLLVGNITTVGAFAALIPLDAPALRDLGFFAAFMLIGTIFFVLIFLPHLSSQNTIKSKEHFPFGKVSSYSPDKNRWMLWLVIALTVFFGYFSFGTSFETDLNRINYLTSEQKKLLENLGVQAGVNDTSNIYIVAEGSSWDKALENRKAMALVLDSLRRIGVIDTYSDVTDFIAPSCEQQRRIDKWNAFWTTHRDKVMGALDSRASVYGFNLDAFSSFRDIVADDYSPKPFEHFTNLRQVVLGSSFSSSEGRFSIVDVVKAKDIESAVKIIDDALGEGGYAFDFAGMNSSIASCLSDDFNYIGFACGLIVFLFLWLSFGRLELTLMAFLPMAMGWFWILGIMNLLGMQFNIVNVILATFIFGQGDDYTIFITEGLIDEFAYRKKVLASFRNSIIISALIMFIGMGSLIVAKHPALHSLAEVAIIGMFSVVLMAWVVPPVIFSLLVKSKKEPRVIPVTFGQIARGALYALTGHMFGVKTVVHGIKEEGKPVHIHGNDLVMPSGRGLVSRGQIHYVYGEDIKVEDTHFFHHYVIYKYIYKGAVVERETRRLLRRYDDFSSWIDNIRSEEIPSGVVSVLNARKGQFSLLMALVHPELQVKSYSYDPDDAAMLSAINPMPENLHVYCIMEEDVSDVLDSSSYIVNLSDF